MSVFCQATPNPNAHKFVLPQWRFAAPRNFSSPLAIGKGGADTATDDPLAMRLFAVEGVYNLFMVQDFVTVNKYPDMDWALIDAQVIAILEEFLKEQRA